MTSATTSRRKTSSTSSTKLQRSSIEEERVFEEKRASLAEFVRLRECLSRP